MRASRNIISIIRAVFSPKPLSPLAFSAFFIFTPRMDDGTHDHNHDHPQARRGSGPLLHHKECLHKALRVKRSLIGAKRSDLGQGC